MNFIHLEDYNFFIEERAKKNTDILPREKAEKEFVAEIKRECTNELRNKKNSWK